MVDLLANLAQFKRHAFKSIKDGTYVIFCDVPPKDLGDSYSLLQPWKWIYRREKESAENFFSSNILPLTT